jgi:hypothetical protein
MKEMVVRVERVDAFIPLYKGGFGHQQALHIVTIEGVAPRLNGWALAARIEFNATIGPVIRITPGRDDDGSYSQYRDIEPICEHCNSYRNRKDIFVLEHCDGRRKIVGRNCLADFLRCDDASDFARMAEFADCAVELADAAERCCDDYPEGNFGAPNMTLDRYLPVVAMLMRRHGWMSRTAARENEDCVSTADSAYRMLFAKDRYTRDWIEEEGLYADEGDNELAGRAIEWAKVVCTDGNEYLDTISRIALSGQVDFGRLDGYAASIIIAYRKACERDALHAERAKNRKSKVWIGNEKKRERGVCVTCKGIHTFEGKYGPTTIVRFEHSVSDDDVAVLVWFASGSKERDWEEGTEYVVDFTCKGHDDDAKYGKQTKINRVKVCA